MMENSMAQNYTKTFNRFIVNSHSPEWLREIQIKGMQEFNRSGFPSRKHEDWRYTNLNALQALDLDMPPDSLFQDLSLCSEALHFIEAYPNRIVFINGQFSNKHTKFQRTEGFLFADLKSIFTDKNPQTEIRDHILQLKAENSFNHLHQAFLHQGTFLKVHAGKSLQEPLHILHINQPEQRDDPLATLICPHTIIMMESGSQATVLESYVSFDEKTYFTNSMTSILVGEDAQLHHNRIEAESGHAFHIGTTDVRLQKSAQYSNFSLSLGGQISRSELNTTLSDVNATATLNGFYAAKGQQVVDNHTTIDHVAPRTTSQQLYKGIIDDQGHAVFNGKIFIRKDAQGTDAHQLVRNLLLSRQAKVDAKPELIIAANDVSCTHGATTGQIDDEEVFYMKSRGIPEEIARQTLVAGFVDDIINTVAHPQIKATMRDLLQRRFLKIC